MSNTSIILLTLANTFNDLVNTLNNTTNSVNELRNGNPYYKDNGDFIVANGALQVLKSSGTGLSINASAIIGGQLTSNSAIITGAMSVGGLAINFTNPNNQISVANTLTANNLFANNLTVSGNTVFEGAQQVAADAVILNALNTTGQDGFLEVYRGGSQSPAFLRWHEADLHWQVSNVTSNVFNDIVDASQLAALPAVLADYGYK